MCFSDQRMIVITVEGVYLYYKLQQGVFNNCIFYCLQIFDLYFFKIDFNRFVVKSFATEIVRDNNGLTLSYDICRDQKKINP
jgi:hypothetical protein